MANYPLVPWMNPVSPVEPYLQGQATGARIGADLADRAMRQQQMQLAAQAQAAENARFQQEYALRKAQAEAEIAIRQQTAEQKRAAEAMRQQAMMDIQRDIDSGMPEAQAYARNWFKTGESLSGLPQMLQMAYPGEPEIKTYKMGDVDVPYAFNRKTGTVSWGKIPTTQRQSESERVLTKLQESKNALEQATQVFASIPDGDPRKAAAEAAVTGAKEQFAYWDAKAKGPVTSITATSPTGETFSINTGQAGAFGGSGVTGDIQKGLRGRGVETMVSKKLAPIESSMEIVNWLENNMNYSTSGLVGGVKRLFGNTSGLLVPGLTPEKPNEIQAKLAILREKIAREIPESGGHLSAASKAEVLAALPSGGMFDNPTVAKQKLNVVRDYLMDQAKNFAAEVGRKPLVSMSVQEIQADNVEQISAVKKQAEAGLISAQEAKRQVETIQAEHQDAINRYWLRIKR